MAISMKRAFNARMLTSMTRYRKSQGVYNDDNDWVEGRITRKPFRGVIKSGNKFSELDKGIALKNMDGGSRFSDFISVSVVDEYELSKEDKVGYKGKYYNILQISDESTYGFFSYIAEKSKEWTP